MTGMLFLALGAVYIALAFTRPQAAAAMALAVFAGLGFQQVGLDCPPGAVFAVCSGVGLALVPLAYADARNNKPTGGA